MQVMALLIHYFQEDLREMKPQEQYIDSSHQMSTN